jgi:hypothetical protein
MNTLFRLCLLLVVFGGGTIVGRYYALERQSPKLFPDAAAAPDPKVFAAVQKGLEKVQADPQIAWGKQWVLRADSPHGVIESDWFGEHKGEVYFKVQVVVWGSHWHVDVWQWDGLPIWPGPVTKKDWSRGFERQIQAHIDDAVRGKS